MQASSTRVPRQDGVDQRNSKNQTTRENTIPPGAALESRTPSAQSKPIPIRRQESLAIINDISELLVEAYKEGETITGIAGTAKSKGGGLARQFGANITERSNTLERKLEVLKALLTPIVLNEKRLSDQDRARLDKIVGNVDVFTDDVALKQALIEIVETLQRLEQ